MAEAITRDDTKTRISVLDPETNLHAVFQLTMKYSRLALCNTQP
jgi:hypothetical protein